MAEEKKGGSQVTKTALKIVLGLALLVVGLWMVWVWKADVLTIVRGFLGLVIIIAGVIFLAIAKE